MSVSLSIMLIAGALIAFGFTIYKIRRSEASVGDSLFWFVFALVLVLLAIFPDIAITCAYSLGFISAANFVFLCVVTVLIVKIFFMTFEIARLRARLDALVQEAGLERFEKQRRETLQVQDAPDMADAPDAPDAPEKD